MTLATDRRLTLTEYLSYSDGTNRRYEFLDGILKPISLGTGKQHQNLNAPRIMAM